MVNNKILVVDDEDDFTNLLRHVLENAGYIVFCANTANAAMRIAGQERPDLVLLDMFIGTTSGYSVIDTLREAKIPTRIICVTNLSNPKDIDRNLRAGACDHISKPFDPEELVQRIKIALSRSDNRLVDNRGNQLMLPRSIPYDESNFVEFKSSLRWDYKNCRINGELVEVVTKTVAGFLNKQGGNLFIGVNDAGDVLGLKNDFKTFPEKGRDGFENFLVTKLTDNLGSHIIQHIEILFELCDEKEFCKIIVTESPEPVYFNDELYVRSGNSTRRLSTKEAQLYIRDHWPIK